MPYGMTYNGMGVEVCKTKAKPDSANHRLPALPSWAGANLHHHRRATSTYDVHLGRIQDYVAEWTDAPHARRSTAIMEGI